MTATDWVKNGDNSDSTSDSPPPIPIQTCNGGDCSPQKSPASPQTRSCRNWRKVAQPHPGRLRRHPARAVGGRRRTPTRRPPRRSPLVAHPRPSTAKRRTKNTQPPRRPQRRGARPRPQGTSSDPSHARRRRPRSARAAETSTRITTPQMCFGGLLPEPTDQYSCGAAPPHASLPRGPLHAGHTGDA